MEEKNKNKRSNIKGSYNSHNTIDKENMWIKAGFMHNEGKINSSSENSGIGCALFDLKGHYLDVNDAYSRILGLSKNTILKRDTIKLSNENVSNEPQDINELMLRGIQGGITELKINEKDLVLSYINTLIYDKEQLPVGIISRIQDITELKGPNQAFSQGRELKDIEEKKDLDPISDFEWQSKKMLRKRNSFNPFSFIFRKFKRDYVTDMEVEEEKPSRIREFFERVYHKNMEIDNFIYELKGGSFWHKKEPFEDFLDEDD